MTFISCRYHQKMRRECLQFFEGVDKIVLDPPLDSLLLPERKVHCEVWDFAFIAFLVMEITSTPLSSSSWRVQKKNHSYSGSPSNYLPDSFSFLALKFFPKECLMSFDFIVHLVARILSFSSCFSCPSHCGIKFQVDTRVSKNIKQRLLQQYFPLSWQHLLLKRQVIQTQGRLHYSLCLVLRRHLHHK